MDSTIDLAEVWATAISGLADGSLTAAQRTIVQQARPLGLLEDTVLVSAPNPWAKDVLETRLRPVVIDALSATLGREIRLAVTVEPADEAEPELPLPSGSAPSDTGVEPERRSRASRRASSSEKANGLVR